MCTRGRGSTRRGWAPQSRSSSYLWSGTTAESLSLIYVLAMLHSSSLMWGQEQISLDEGVGERRGWEQRNVPRAGEGFPWSGWCWLGHVFRWKQHWHLGRTGKQRLWLGHWAVLGTPGSARAVCRGRTKCDPVDTWHLSSTVGLSACFAVNWKGSKVDEKDWEFLLVLQRKRCVRDEEPLYKWRLRAPGQRNISWAHLRRFLLSRAAEFLSPTYFSS